MTGCFGSERGTTQNYVGGYNVMPDQCICCCSIYLLTGVDITAPIGQKSKLKKQAPIKAHWGMNHAAPCSRKKQRAEQLLT